MTNSYKGFTVPEIMQDDKLYHIISDEGVFNGWSELAVLKKWEGRVDANYRLKALEDGYTDIFEDVLGCPKCGAMVFDVYLHETFHQGLTTEE